MRRGTECPGGALQLGEGLSRPGNFSAASMPSGCWVNGWANWLESSPRKRGTHSPTIPVPGRWRLSGVGDSWRELSPLPGSKRESRTVAGGARVGGRGRPGSRANHSSAALGAFPSPFDNHTNVIFSSVPDASIVHFGGEEMLTFCRKLWSLKDLGWRALGEAGRGEGGRLRRWRCRFPPGSSPLGGGGGGARAGCRNRAPRARAQPAPGTVLGPAPAPPAAGVQRRGAPAGIRARGGPPGGPR